MKIKESVLLFAQAIVNLRKCNNVDAVLDDYESSTDTFYVYKHDYELYKEILKLQENEGL